MCHQNVSHIPKPLVVRLDPNDPNIVVGIPDEEWGEIIGASLILKGNTIDLDALKGWLKTKLPAYQLPRKYIFQEDLPRNVMGKVTKNELKQLF